MNRFLSSLLASYTKSPKPVVSGSRRRQVRHVLFQVESLEGKKLMSAAPLHVLSVPAVPAEVAKTPLPAATPAATPAPAATPVTLTWTGAGGNTDWSNPKNWNLDEAPINGDTLVFPANATSKVSWDMMPNLTTLSAIEFTGSGYTVEGVGTTLTGNIYDEATGGSNTLQADFKITGTHDIYASAGNQLNIEGVFQGSGAVVIDGPGTIDALYMGAGFDNTGGVVLAEGTLAFQGSWGPAQLTVDGGTTLQDTGGFDGENAQLVVAGNATFKSTYGLGLNLPTLLENNATLTVELPSYVAGAGVPVLNFYGGFTGGGHLTLVGSGEVMLPSRFASYVSDGSGNNTLYLYEVADDGGGGIAVAPVITGHATSPTATQINWTKVSGATGYLVQVLYDGQWYSCTHGSGTTFPSTYTGVTITGVTSGLSWTWRVGAITPEGTLFSNTIEITQPK